MRFLWPWASLFESTASSWPMLDHLAANVVKCGTVACYGDIVCERVDRLSKAVLHAISHNLKLKLGLSRFDIVAKKIDQTRRNLFETEKFWENYFLLQRSNMFPPGKKIKTSMKRLEVNELQYNESLGLIWVYVHLVMTGLSSFLFPYFKFFFISLNSRYFTNESEHRYVVT